MTKLSRHGIYVCVCDGVLCYVPMNPNGTPAPDTEPEPLDVVCVHLLDDANAALGTHFDVQDFDFLDCMGHE